MQRRRHISNLTYINIRNISAHAEKTKSFQVLFTSQLKHLCACRENEGAKVDGKRKQETSLRLQRKPESPGGSAFKFRNISAHAEKTKTLARDGHDSEKHLCACREDCGQEDLRRVAEGNISAHAEKTTTAFASPSLWGNISAHAEKTILLVVIRL